MRTPEREITAPVDLCRPDGGVNPDAVGWTRRPLHRANLRGWGRTKRWEYWGIVSPTHVIGLTLSSLDYAGVHGVYVLDRRSGRESVQDAVVPLARGVALPDRSGVGTAAAGTRSTSLEFATVDAGTRLRVTAPGISLDVVAHRPAGQESLGVVVPWSDRLFQYTVKDLARPVEGVLALDGDEVRLEPTTSFAVLDHGRGRWPYSMTWNWAAGSGAGGRGIQLGGKWTEGTGMTENAVLVDGRMHKIGEELRWEYDRGDWLRPWRISGATAEVTFVPFHERVARTSLGVVASETHQCFGEFSGWATTDDGDRVDLAGLVGWAEEARNRW
ncbi:DUF2804 domain-containing protein [Blastococcus sp. LR1]|uniref:DUF2804 domain-containing protein n=1 Tax=Blastococcus sp. LR1 TaxID=2877000 RepID=UPI001CCC1108|nr:DUF2804 domain-containing protein [Blastococcus sp. LR1]MCA0147101.1 DUF2804 domain-containing protein [Blastococcus sp. LR1]